MSYLIHILRGGILIADSAALGSVENDATLLRVGRNDASGAATIIGGMPDALLFGDFMRMRSIFDCSKKIERPA